MTSSAASASSTGRGRRVTAQLCIWQVSSTYRDGKTESHSLKHGLLWESWTNRSYCPPNQTANKPMTSNIKARFRRAHVAVDYTGGCLLPDRWLCWNSPPSNAGSRCTGSMHSYGIRCTPLNLQVHLPFDRYFFKSEGQPTLFIGKA